MSDCVRLTREEEQDLARKALAGDVDARNRVIMGFYPLLLREAWRIAKNGPGRDKVELADIGFLHAIESFNGYDPERGFRAHSYFLRGCIAMMNEFVRNRDCSICLPGRSHLPSFRGSKKTKDLIEAAREALFEMLDEFGEKAPATAGETPDEQASRSEVRQQFHERLKQLRPEDRELILLHLREIPMAEIGRRYGLCRERIRQKLFRIKQKLRAIMQGILD